MRQYHTPLVSCETLFENTDDPNWIIFDCRHDLQDNQLGPRLYAKGHIQRAVHAHLDRDLSGPVGNGSKGRHPLPIPGAFTRFMTMSGVTAESQIVAYDASGGAYASRLWWLARHFGHENVAVLDGGIDQWRSLGLPLVAQHHRQPTGKFEGSPGHMPTMEADQLADATIIDARSQDRYNGENEPIDPVAGHIPGAINRPFAKNLGPDGLFLSPDEVRSRFEDCNAPTVTYCGSGVTAAHNVLANELAGLPPMALYPGSWSQWCHEGRPVAQANQTVTKPDVAGRGT